MIFKKLLFSIIAFISVNTNATTITIINPYKAGGGADIAVEAIKPTLDKKGIKIDTEYVKSCDKAILSLNKESENTLLVIHSSSYGSDCNLKLNEQLEEVYTLTTVATYLCYSPNNQTVTLNTKDARIGTIADNTKTYLEKFLHNSKVVYEVKIFPYNSSSDLTRAVISGDVDIWFASGPTDKLIAMGSKCIASSMKNNVRKYPFLGQFTKAENNFEELNNTMKLFTIKKSLDDLVYSSLNQLQNR